MTRFFSGSDHLVEQRWYIADHDAPVLPFPSAFLNADWDKNESEQDYHLRDNLGEQLDAPRVADFSPGPQHATGAHQCGERDWWTKGIPWSTTRPPVVYSQDGLPTCCAPGRGIMWGRALGTPRGGLLWGSAVPAWPYGQFAATSMVLNPDLSPGHWSAGFPGSVFNLFGPEWTGSNRWEYTAAISVFNFNTWETFDWDGFGTRTFTWVSGTAPGSTTDVERIG